MKCEPDADILYSLIRCLKQKFVGNIEDWADEVSYNSRQVEQIINVFENLNDTEKVKFKENENRYNLFKKYYRNLR